MKATQRMQQLFGDLYEGSPWLGVNIKDTLDSISAEQASKRIAPGRNTIWEILNHMVQWRLNVMERLKGKVIQTPEHNYILPIANPSETEWNISKKELKNSQLAWLAFLEDFNEKAFGEIYPNNQMTYYEHVHGILQHDAYHLGQIVLLSKLV